MRSIRRCTRNSCDQPAVATLTYIYSDSTAVIGPLAMQPEPHTYDLCQTHARSLTAPRGWELVRPDTDYPPPPVPADDLVALAEAVWDTTAGEPSNAAPRRGDGGSHLRLVPPS